jgi:hypothetical protein
MFIVLAYMGVRRAMKCMYSEHAFRRQSKMHTQHMSGSYLSVRQGGEQPHVLHRGLLLAYTDCA